MPKEDIPPSADPDRLLAALAYMANATPGVTKKQLTSAVARETGFVLSAEDATQAMNIYRGAPRKDDLDWFAEDRDPYVATQTVSAALRVGSHDGLVTADGRRTLHSIAQAVGMSAEEFAMLVPEAAREEEYDLFPIADSVSHWIGRLVRPLLG